MIDTVGGDLGVFVSNELKVGFSFSTLAGLLSRNKDDDVFDAVQGSYGTPDRYSGLLNALEPADFSYSTAALKFEYLFYNGSTFGWSTTTNFGQGVFGSGKIINDSGLEKDEYTHEDILPFTEKKELLKFPIGQKFILEKQFCIHMVDHPFLP